MYKECKTEQSIQRQRHIAACLRKLMETEDYRQITVSALCEFSGVPRKGFYRYFDSKDDVFHLIAEQMLTQCTEYCNRGKKNVVDVDKERLVRCFEFWRENRSLLTSIHNSSMADVWLKYYIEHSIRQAQRHVVGYDDKRQMQTVFAVCGMYALICNWHLEGYAGDPEEMAERAVQVLTEPLVKHIEW